MATSPDKPLGAFLKGRRARLNPVDCGFGPGRRRTPGLRREEVAQRAGISVTWYTWLEQGRGGAPSAEVLDQLAEALRLTAAEREHLFLLAQNRPPGVQGPSPGVVTPRLRRVLDSLELCPAYVKTSVWDVVAWNRAAAAVLTDYGALPPERRNLLRMFFGPPEARAHIPNWEPHARLLVAAFRLETARTGARESVQALIDELSRSSPEFASMWLDDDVRSYGEGTKHVEHRVAGRIELEFSCFAVDDQPDLGLVIYAPATAADRERIRSLLAD